MESFVVSVNAVVPIFLLMALGYLAKSLGFLDRTDVAKFNKVLFRFFFPVMLFYNIYTSDISSAVQPKLILFAEGGVFLAFFLSWLFAHLVIRERRQRGVVTQGIYRSNFVIIGFAIVSALMGEADMGPVAVLMAIVVPTFNVLAVIILEYYAGEKVDPKKTVLDILKNPLILGSAVGILFLLTGWKLPTALESVARQMNQAASPILLFLLGAFFRFDGLKKHRRQLIYVCVGRLAVIPGILLSLAAVLGFRGVELAALIGIFGSSNAATSFPMAQQMGGDAELAGNIVVATSALCSFTLFLWCFLFKSLGYL